MPLQLTEQEQTEERSPFLFIKEVAKYFMDFLETDFHKQRAPKRSIRFRDSNGLLIGVNLKKYVSFAPKLPHLINRGFSRSLVSDIGRGVHRTEIPRGLIELVRIQTERISQEQISKIASTTADEIAAAAASHSKEYDKALTRATDAATHAIQKQLVVPLISNLEKPLQNLELGDESRVYLMQEELTAILAELLNNKISELLRLTLGKQQPDSLTDLLGVFELTEVRAKVLAFFESFKVGDLFLELFEMERNKKILDKQELYLYFYDITYDGVKYPIFYIPFSLTLQSDLLKVEFDSQVYINKRALEYVVQEVNEQLDRRGTLKCCAERIIYLAEHETDFSTVLEAALQELTNVLQLDQTIDVADPTSQVAKSQLVKISNGCYFGLFDRADEALVNDYEDILRLLALGKDNPLAVAFEKLIDDFIHRDPESVNPAVENDWDDAAPSDRLVFASPIPLNSEQRQILSALNKNNCKYITVQGPPGTGKSHTITAVVFDAIQKDQSVLVLSDKKEALDVVEDKITQTMNRVRFDKDFQNPILRLGRTGSTYSEILSSASIDNIKTQFRAVKKEYSNVATAITTIGDSLKEDIDEEIDAYSDVDIGEIRELIELEQRHAQSTLPLILEEFLDSADGASDLDELRSVSSRLRETLGFSAKPSPEMAGVLKILGWQASNRDSADDVIERAAQVNDALVKVQAVTPQQIKSIGTFQSFSRPSLPVLRSALNDYDACRNRLFGYMFKRRELEEKDAFVRSVFRLTSVEKPHKILNQLRDAFGTLVAIDVLTREDSGTAAGFDLLFALHQFLIHPELRPCLETLMSIQADCVYIWSEVVPKYPKSMQTAGINNGSVASLMDNWIAKMEEEDCDGLIRHLNLKQELHKAFSNVPSVNYGDQQSSIEDLVTVQMTHALDGRVIDFYTNNRATAMTVREIIRSKRRFPKEEFGKLKRAFPCILAGIRDYAEYIPLEADLFDLLIIDEASQVSVAQAFPALLRSKKVLILGDKKQFSNVKAAQARSDTNREYVNRLREVFVGNVSDKQAQLVRLEKFNIKASVLEFFELISNYQIQLAKYFRGYKEIIAFSNTHFYRNSLQVMKIRARPIDDVLKFSYVSQDARPEREPKANSAEVDFIISELRSMRDARSTTSVGIITPHTNQQKLLIETINRMPERDYFFDTMKLKIMTFDTCQGEERDIVFYSMVATKADDRLWGVFIKDLENVDVEEEGQIKAQRLNVGLSRAKECMHFVLSKPLDEYKGSIGEALRHYDLLLTEGRKERSVEEVDQASGMESAVLHWFYQTTFWQQNKSRSELFPQFEIGKYLKQLDPRYQHPMYRVDFLLVVREPGQSARKIIIEYDGFVEHFADLPGINDKNYADYYSEEDVYRQKVLEGYGCRFLRINRFNCGKNPIQTLDQRLNELLAKDKKHNPTIDDIHFAIEGMHAGNLKECPKCKELRPLTDFENKALASGYSRNCVSCRARTVSRTTKSKIVVPGVASVSDTSRKCSRCGARMVMRSGRYGRFLGCSKYPYCKATQKV